MPTRQDCRRVPGRLCERSGQNCIGADLAHGRNDRRENGMPERGFDLDAAADLAQPLAHSGKAKSGKLVGSGDAPRRQRVRRLADILDRQHDRLLAGRALERERDARLRAARMAMHVGDGVLDDPEQDDFDLGGEPYQIGRQCQIDSTPLRCRPAEAGLERQPRPASSSSGSAADTKRCGSNMARWRSCNLVDGRLTSRRCVVLGRATASAARSCPTFSCRSVETRRRSSSWVQIAREPAS